MLAMQWQKTNNVASRQYEHSQTIMRLLYWIKKTEFSMFSYGEVKFSL